MNTFVHIVVKLGTQLTHASNQRVEGREGITYYIIILFFLRSYALCCYNNSKRIFTVKRNHPGRHLLK